jgi:hypothetical protein
LTPQLLKAVVTKYLNGYLDHVRTTFENSQDWKDCVDKAYPTIVAPKKEKKSKGGGTLFPGPKEKIPQRQKKDEAGKGEAAKVPTPVPEPPKPS